MHPFRLILRRLLVSVAAGTPVGLCLSLAEPLGVAVAGGALAAMMVYLFLPIRKDCP